MVEFVVTDDRLSVKFSGRMDTAASQQTEKQVYEKLAENKVKACEFDLKAVDYIASAFLRICITASQRMANSGFAIINTQPQVKKVFQIAGVAELLNVS